jgi:NADH-quinone oxidoreductase subunit F
MQTVLLSRPPDSGRQSLEEYRAEGGYVALAAALKGSSGGAGAAGSTSTAETRSAALSPSDVVQIITESDLRGRGGAAFPTGRKWALAAAAEGSPKYVVANGGEHEPGSGKDRLLISDYPHKVLEGVALCAYATGASAPTST